MSLILALDQGTTSSRAILFDQDGDISAVAQKEFAQIFPQAGMGRARSEGDLDVADRRGRPRRWAAADVAPAGHRRDRHHQPARDDRRLGPRDRRADLQRHRLAGPPHRRDLRPAASATGAEQLVRGKTGLVLDAYFSGTSSRWILDNVPGRARARRGGRARVRHRRHLALWKLTGGRVHVTDASNASRTMLFNIHTRRLGRRAAASCSRAARRCCPRCARRARSTARRDRARPRRRVRSPASRAISRPRSSARCCFDAGHGEEHLRHRLLHAAEHRRQRRSRRSNKLLTTVAWRSARAGREYALEGSVFIGGAVVQWLRDGLGLHPLARPKSSRWPPRVPDNGGVYLVPAFAGLGAPHWDAVRARHDRRAHARHHRGPHRPGRARRHRLPGRRSCSTRCSADAGIRLTELRVDGGAAATTC